MATSTKPASALVPRQERSRKTLAKLLDATVCALEAHGLEGCTLPRVAAAAGVSTAAVYRHFEDKETLLRGAFLHALQTSSPTTASRAPKAATLEAAADQIVAALLADSQAHARVLQALAQFLAAAPDATFARQVQALRATRLQPLVDAVLEHRERIRHAEPQRAALFAVLAATASIEAAASFSAALPLTPKQFSAEVARIFVAYLRRKP